MNFEYDPVKSKINLSKHGIDFEDAQKLWLDLKLIIFPSKYPDEERYLAIGIIEEKHWTAIFTERDENTRIISIRRSRSKEETIYERNKFKEFGGTI